MLMFDQVKSVFAVLLSFSEPLMLEFLAMSTAGAASKRRNEGVELLSSIPLCAAGCIVKLGVRFNRFLSSPIIFFA